MSEKKKKKTKITSGAPAGQADNEAAVQHVKKERDEAKSMDEKHGSHGQEPKKKADEGKKGGDSIKDAVKFVNEVKNEARKITWPPRRQVMQETWSVIVLVTVITIMVLGFDYALGNWVFGPIEHFAKVMAPTEQLAVPTKIPGTPMPPVPNGTPATPGGTPAPGTPAPGTVPPVTPPPGSTTPVPPTGTVPAPTASAPAPSATTPAPAATTPATPAPTTTPPVTTPPASPAAQTPAPAAAPQTTPAPQTPPTTKP